MPGFKYETPPNQNKINPYELTGQEVLKILTLMLERLPSNYLIYVRALVH